MKSIKLIFFFSFLAISENSFSQARVCEIIDGSLSRSYPSADYVVAIDGYEFAGYSGPNSYRTAKYLIDSNPTVSKICAGETFSCSIKLGGKLPRYSSSNVGVLIGEDYAHAAWTYESIDDYWTIRSPLHIIKKMVKFGICTFSL